MTFVSKYLSWSVFIPFIATSAASDQGACHSTIEAVRQALDGYPRMKPIENCLECQGRAGKRGPVGPTGPIGQRGTKGEAGECSCDLSFVDDMVQKIKQLEDVQRQILKKVTPEMCYAGISNGEIPISNIRASSSHAHCVHTYFPLNSERAWCAGASRPNEWIEIDLRTARSIVGVATQGRKNSPQWVTSYKVSYGNSPSALTFYQENGTPKVFSANKDQNTIVKNKFSHPVVARYFRLYPVTYHQHMSVRAELLEC